MATRKIGLRVALDLPAAAMLFRQRSALPVLKEVIPEANRLRANLLSGNFNQHDREELDTIIKARPPKDLQILLAKVVNCTFTVVESFENIDGDSDVIVVSPIAPDLRRRTRGDDDLYLLLTSELSGLGWLDCEELRFEEPRYVLRCRPGNNCQARHGDECRVLETDVLTLAGNNFLPADKEGSGRVRIMRPAEAWSLICWLATNFPKYKDRVDSLYRQGRASALSAGLNER